MTGRPPSNGCLPCKKRRKRCDLLQPACTRCVKLSSDCQYAPKTWKFIDANSSVLAEQPRSLTKDTRVFSAAANLVRVTSRFWEQYLSTQADGDRADLAARPYFLMYRQMASRDNVLQRSLDAVALLCISQQNNDSVLSHHGSCMYVEAIAALNRALQHPSRAISDAVLASCRAIALYEMFRPADENAEQRGDWATHIAGMSSIVALRRQAATLDHFSLSIHADARALAGHCALRMRSPAIFASFGSVTFGATLQDSITDCMASVSGWLEQHDTFVASVQQSLETGTFDDQSAQLFADGLRVLQELQNWEQLVFLFCGIAIDHGVATSPDKRCILLLDTVITAGHRIWFVVMQYWSLCVALCSQLHFTWQYLLLIRPCMALSELPSSVTATPYARCIAASTPTLFSNNAGLWTLEQILLPVTSVVCYYAALDTRSSWELDQVQKALSSCKNAVFARGFLRDVKHYDVEEDEEVEQQRMELKTASAREWYHLPINCDDIWLP